MTSKEIHILIEINEKHAASFEQCEDIRERTIRLNTLNSVMNDIIDLIIERIKDEESTKRTG